MEAYPLQWPHGWPRTKYPKQSRFGRDNSPSVDMATWQLMHELKLLGSVNVILSTNVPLRKDGLPYSSFREPADKGVAVYFKYNKQDNVIACDAFNKIGCNIYALAKTIEAMRGIDRWGCSDMISRAFTGFKALPQQTTVIEKNWWDVLEVHQWATPELIKAAHRKLIMKHHPDKGGNVEMFHQVQMAFERSGAK